MDDMTKLLPLRHRWIPRVAATALLLALPNVTAQAHEAGESFAQYLKKPQYVELLDELTTIHGFDRKELEQLFARSTFQPEIPKKFARPAESLPYDQYRPLFISPQIVERGKRFYQERQELLKRIEEEFGVDSHIIVAILGVETRFGKTPDGGFLVFDALNTTFVGVPNRTAFARKELIEFLLLCREENIDPLSVKGSYAGAMGTPQFISSSYRHYSVDFDGDGKRDLWNSDADILGSVGNYLKRHKWQRGEPVRLPVSADGTEPQIRSLLNKGIEEKSTVEALLANGVSWAGDTNPVNGDAAASLLAYPSPDGEQTVIVLQNFRSILTYNHAINYALVVSDLADLLRAE